MRRSREGIRGRNLLDLQFHHAQVRSAVHPQEIAATLGTGFFAVAHFRHRAAIQTDGLAGRLFDLQHGVLGQRALGRHHKSETQCFDLDPGQRADGQPNHAHPVKWLAAVLVLDDANQLHAQRQFVHGEKLQGSSTVEPVVRRASRSRCAWAASARG